jgi:hypothetical protein
MAGNIRRENVPDRGLPTPEVQPLAWRALGETPITSMEGTL